MKIVQRTLLLTLLLAAYFSEGSAYAFLDTSSLLRDVAFIVGIGTILLAFIGFVIYRATKAKHDRDLARFRDHHQLARPPDMSSDVRRRVIRAAREAGVNERGASAISQVFEEETRSAVENVRKEYTEKFRAVLNEKEQEVISAKEEAATAKENYESIDKIYKKVDAEKKTTEAVVRSISEGLVVVNQKGEVLLLNPSAEKILGTQQEKKIGKSILEDLQGEILVSLSKDTETLGERTIEYKSKDESVRKVIRSSSAIIQNEEGQTVGMVNVLTDVTKQREIEEMKSQFISNITHELRTPIVAMRQAIALLLNETAGMINPTQLKFLGITSRNLMQLSQFVEDMLDMEKIEKGSMTIKPVLVKPDKIINEACDALAAWVKSKELQVVRDIDPNLPEMLLDPDRITQVLNNLIGNAIKFTPRGGKITVGASCWLDGETFQVNITDTGCGISSENIQKIFKRFSQFGDQQGISGTGLGLCIAKDLIERHGGQISVESQEKKGSKFYFTIPVKR